MTEISLFILH